MPQSIRITKYVDENVLIADSELKLKDAIDKTVWTNKKKSLFNVRRQCLIVSNIDSPVVVSLNSEFFFLTCLMILNPVFRLGLDNPVEYQGRRGFHVFYSLEYILVCTLILGESRVVRKIPKVSLSYPSYASSCILT